jgi:hypothetical protein
MRLGMKGPLSPPRRTHRAFVRLDRARTEMVKATMPIPPSQCMKDRQKRRVAGIVSGTGMRVSPVQVQPDIASKRLSM